MNAAAPSGVVRVHKGGVCETGAPPSLPHIIPRPLEVRSSNPELNDLALYKIHYNYADNYTKPSHGAHRSQLTHTHIYTHTTLK